MFFKRKFPVNNNVKENKQQNFAQKLTPHNTPRNLKVPNAKLLLSIKNMKLKMKTDLLFSPDILMANKFGMWHQQPLTPISAQAKIHCKYVQVSLKGASISRPIGIAKRGAQYSLIYLEKLKCQADFIHQFKKQQMPLQYPII